MKVAVEPPIVSSELDVAPTISVTTSSLTSLSPSTSTSASTATISVSTSATAPTASKKKLMQSISSLLDEQSSASESEGDEVYEGHGVRLLELEGLQSAL